MRLRRGMVRESCDFCHRRKIKCDRLPRNGQGHPSCSQCSLRRVPCRMDDSDDVRLRGRQPPSARGRALRHRASPSEDGDDDVPGTRKDASTISLEASRRNTRPAGPMPLTPAPRQLTPTAYPARSLATPSSLSGLDGRLLSPSPSSSLQPPPLPSILNPSSLTDDLAFMDGPFQLNADSIFFLDKIFMGYPEGSMWPAQSTPAGSVSYQPMLGPDEHQFPAAPACQPHQQPQQQQLPAPRRDGGYDPPPWARCGIREDVFVAALHAYFEYTTIYLPVLLEDAFWQDYAAGRCSLGIIYAVACRGLPFTAHAGGSEDTWAMQQRVGAQFSEAFFAAQLRANNSRGRVRLDDLEALALMVQFKYHKQGGQPSDDLSSPPAPSPPSAALAQLHAHLASLYLTHDSLVLMTMQSGVNGVEGGGAVPGAAAGDAGDDPTEPLSRVADRRILLFWHVYGLDAFHCLDKKTLSRIPDCGVDVDVGVGVDMTKSLPRDAGHAPAARGYLDAVLDLSVIARKALALSNAASRRRGVRAEDVLAIYGLLDGWQHRACPPHLRHQRDARGQLCLGDVDSDSPTGAPHAPHAPHVQLHRAVVYLLEINCYMQVEACVSEYGIYQGDDHDDGGMMRHLEAETLALRVESASVQRLRDAVDISRCIRPKTVDGATGKAEYSLADLGTSIVRDICASAARWACHRGHAWLQRPLPGALRSRRLDREDADRQRHVGSYLEAATVLRDAVSTASSHADTMPTVQGLDADIATLARRLQEIRGSD